MDLTILILCLNEQKSIAATVGDARRFLGRNAIDGEVLVLDNGSTDGSVDAAREAGARVVTESVRGYGRAIIAGIAAARGRAIILGDGDGEHDLNALEAFWEQLQGGVELVVGNRFAAGSDRGGMRLLNRFVGAPLLSAVGRLLFPAVAVRDFHCGLRGFNTAQIRRLALRAPGMESASEMIVKAARSNLRIAEVPVTQRPATDADRAPHLRIWRDGWRHVRLLLLLSPRWLFLQPGCLAVVTGVVLMAVPFLRADWLGNYAMVFGAGLVVCGTQLIGFALAASVFGDRVGLGDGKWSAWVVRQRVAEKVLGAGLALGALGLVGSAWSVVAWAQAGGDPSLADARLRIAIPSVMLFVLAVQSFFSGFLLTLFSSRELH